MITAGRAIVVVITAVVIPITTVGRVSQYTLSGRIGKVVASHAAVARSIPAEFALINTMHEVLRGYSP